VKKRVPLVVGIALEMYQRRCTDKEISSHIGCAVSTVAAWRKIHGYPANPKEAKENIPLLTQLYGQGLTDAEVAGYAGLEESRAKYLRYRFAIPLPPRVDYDEVDRLLDQKVSCARIARSVGCSKSAVYKRKRTRKRRALCEKSG
jgi:hypothetical protein